mmetsp:Transcript_42643/g.91049  ORF Transcript_42643/g.91049 Transcript_42643/m.91049 type:complete len:217 (-) Transcript_42643:138-788(-)
MRMVPPLAAGDDAPSANEQQKTLARTRRAVLIGSSIPLILSIVWTACTTALFADPSGGSADPVISLMRAPPATAVPVKFVAASAIGTTIISSLLTFEQFVNDALCLALGGCPPNGQQIARAITIGLPALLACAGPSLYLPLLGFAGAFPTTLLYGLVPPLTLFILRSAVRSKRREGISGGLVRPLLPGGTLILGALGAIAASMLGLSSWLAIQSTR